MSEPVAVAVPKGTVYLEPSVTVPIAMACLTAIEGTPANEPSMQASFVAVFLQPRPRGAIVGWTGKHFAKARCAIEECQETGHPLTEIEPLTDANIARLLSWTEGGLEVAEKCDSLYAGDIFRPLAERRRRLSLDGPTAVLTPATPTSGSKHQKPSRRSSPNGTAGMASVVPVP